MGKRKNIRNKNDNDNNENNIKIKKKKNKYILKTFFILLLIAILSFGIFFVIRMNENGWNLKGFTATLLGHDASTLENLSELQFLIIGQSQNLTDTIMVCSYNPKTQNASILSIPRDTFTGKNKNVATAYEKINALYQDSPEKLLAKVNEITGLNIRYYIHVDTKGLTDLVDAIGGVTFDVPINMKYDDSSQNLHINLKAGTQILDGDKAEQLVRFRHNNNGKTYPAEYGIEDVGRMRTQREFLKVVAQQMLKKGSLNKIDNYIKIANKYMTTNFNFASLKDYAPYALEFNLDNLNTQVLPGGSEKCNGTWLYMYNKSEVKLVVNELFGNKEVQDNSSNTTSGKTQNIEKNKKIEILNGTSSSSNLTELKKTLENNGYKVVKTGTTSKTSKTAIINRTKQEEGIVNELKSVIGLGSVSAGNKSTEIDFTIIIGNDF